MRISAEDLGKSLIADPASSLILNSVSSQIDTLAEMNA